VLYTFDDFELDGDDLELRRNGSLLKVDALVLRLLSVLVRNAGRLVTKEELIEEVWDGRAIADNAITVSMARLRKTLGESRKNRELIATAYGRGYRFVQPVAVALRPSHGGAAIARKPATLEAPFVGRERVVQLLLEALGKTRLARGRACVLLGEAGIGKTRVVEQLERAALSTNVRVAWGYCREAGDTPPLWPWLRLLRDVTGDTWSPSTGDAARKHSKDSSPRHELFDSIVRTLVTAAEQAPWVLVLEDLHRADAASIELLSHMLDEISRTRILIVATVRASRTRLALRPETHLPRVLGHRNSERIMLERLQPDEVSAYVGALFDDPTGNLGRAVFSKSEGNPFFMTELARSLNGTESPTSESLAVLDSALDLLRQRVAGLDPSARAVLEAAAVIGRSFELSVLAAVLERDPSELMIAIDDAIADEIVIAAPESATAFAFGHELQRSVLYDAVGPREQRALHLRIADVLERKLEQGEPIPPSELAFHSHAALPDGDLRATVRRCRSAANAAASVFAIPDLLRYAHRALEALDLIEGGSVRLRMALLFQIAAYSRGHAWQEVERASSELTRLAREHTDGAMLARAAAMRNLHPELQPLAGAAAAAEHALELLDPEQHALRAMATAQLACSPPRCYAREQCIPLIREASELAHQSRDRNAIIPVVLWQMHLEGGPEHGHASEVCAELESLLLAGAREMPPTPLMLALFRATVALQRGDLAAVRPALVRAESIARLLNHLELIWHVLRCKALMQINTGAVAEGRQQLEQLPCESQHRPATTYPMSAFDRAVLLEVPEGGLRLSEIEARALEHRAWDPPGLWALKLRALASAGFLDDARAALRLVAPDALAQLPSDSQYLGTLGHLTRAALALDAREYFEPLLSLLLRHPSYFSAQLSFLCEGSMLSLAGRLLLALDRKDEAMTQLQEGLAAEQRAGLAGCAVETERLLRAL
jgi:DNA-binding winged helix-turn-helix (wHTH) protein